MGRQEHGVWRLFIFFWVYSGIFPSLSSNEHKNFFVVVKERFSFPSLLGLPNNNNFFPALLRYS